MLKLNQENNTVSSTISHDNNHSISFGSFNTPIIRPFWYICDVVFVTLINKYLKEHINLYLYNPFGYNLKGLV